jgi:hypothetical protein
MDYAAWWFETIVIDNSGQFGFTTRDINGAIECSASYNENTPQKRFRIFDALAQAVGLTGYNTNGCYLLLKDAINTSIHLVSIQQNFHFFNSVLIILLRSLGSGENSVIQNQIYLTYTRSKHNLTRR